MLFVMPLVLFFLFGENNNKNVQNERKKVNVLILSFIYLFIFRLFKDILKLIMKQQGQLVLHFLNKLLIRK